MPSDLSDSTKRLVSIREASEILGVSIDTLRRWDKEGKITSLRPDKKNRYFRLEELEELKLNKKLSISEVSKLLGISQTTLRRIEEKGLITPERLHSGERAYDKKGLENFLHSEYFVNQKEVEDKILETLSDSDNHKENLTNTRVKIISVAINEEKTKVDSLLRFRKKILYGILSLFLFFLIVVGLITFFFLRFPQQTAQYFGYRDSSNQPLFASALGNSNRQVLGASTTNFGNTDILKESLRPFSSVSLEVVKVISPETYQKVAPKTINDVFIFNETSGVVPRVPILFPQSGYLKIPDTKLINNLNADYIRGKVPTDGEGNLAVINKGYIQDLRINQDNIANLNITNSDISLAAGISDTKLEQISTTNKVLGSAIQLSSSGGIVNSSGLSLIRSCGSNQVLVWNGSSWVCADQTGSGASDLWTKENGNLYPNDSTVNLGIGTLNPQNKLDVAGGVALGNYAGSNTAPANGLIVSGNVGINTSNPVSTLDVNGTETVSSILPKTSGSYSQTSTTPIYSLASGWYNDNQKYIAIGSDGFARILVNDTRGGHNNIFFIRCQNDSCSSKITTEVATNVNGVDEPTISIGSDNLARIVYTIYDSPNQVHLIRCLNADCTSKNDTLVYTSPYANGGFWNISSTIGSDDKVRIVFQDTDSDNQQDHFRFIECNDLDCSSPNLTTFSATASQWDFEQAAIRMGSDGFARIAYTNEDTNEIHYIQCFNDDCSNNNDQLVVANVHNPYYIDLAIGSDDNGRIVYEDNVAGDKFVQCTNSSCSTKNLTQVGDSNNYDEVSIVMGLDDLPRISFGNESSHTQTYVRCNSADCSNKNTIVISSDSYYQSSMALGFDGSVGIVYSNANQTEMIFTRLASDDGSDQAIGSNIGSATSPFGLIAGTKLTGQQLVIQGDLTNALQVNNASGSGIFSVDTLGSLINVNANTVLANTTSVSSTEEVTNGDFSGNADNWILGNGWIYNNNNVSFTLPPGAINQSSILNRGSGYSVGDTLTVQGGNNDAQYTVSSILAYDYKDLNYSGNNFFTWPLVGNLGNSGYDGISQSFIATSSYNLNFVDLELYKYGSPTDGLKITIRTGSPEGTELGTSDELLASNISSGNWNRFSFSSPIAITSGNTYYITVYRTGAYDTSNFYYPYSTGNYNYPGGSEYVKYYGSWQDWSGSSYDLIFGTLEDGTTTTQGPITSLSQVNAGTGYTASTYDLTGGTGSGGQITVASITVNDKDLAQAGSLNDGSSYHVSFNLGGTTGSVQVCLGNGDCQTFTGGSGEVSFNGVYRFGSSSFISITPSNDFDGIIGNVSVKDISNPSRTIGVAAQSSNGINGTDLTLSAGNSLNYNGGNLILQSGGGNNNGLIKFINGSNIAGVVDSSGNFGIGTDNPNYKLDVNGTVNASEYCISGDCITSWLGDSGRWATSGNDIYNVNSGNVGIGTTSPAVALDVVGKINTSLNYQVNGVDGITLGSASCVTTNGGIVTSSGDCPGGGSSGQWTTSGNDIYNANSGNVGIGTSNPLYNLHVYSATNDSIVYSETGSTTNRAEFVAKNPSTSISLSQFAVSGEGTYAGVSLNNASVLESGGSNLIVSYDAGSVIFINGTTEMMRLDHNGNLGLGTNSPTAILDIAGSASLSGNLSFNGEGTNNINLLNNSNLNFITSPAGTIGNSGGDIGTFSTINQGQLPQGLYHHTTVTATIGGTTYVYVLGGVNGSGWQSTVYKAAIDSNGDIGTFDTTNQGQLPQDLYYHTTVTATIAGTTYIYVLGGYGNSGMQSTVYKATIDSNGDIGAFDTTNQGQLPQILIVHTSVTATIGGTTYIYVLGGQDNSNLESTVYKAAIDSNGDIGAFDTTNQGQLPQALNSHTTITVTIAGTTYVYILGGISNSSTQSTVYKATINPTTGDIGTFDTTNQGQLPQTLYHHTTVTATIGGTTYIYVLGGEVYGLESTVYKATIDSSGDIGTFDTINQGQLPQAFTGHTTVTATTGGTTYIYVLGGWGSSSVLSTVYRAQISNSAVNTALSITNNGNVGIATTAPTALLDVNGTASLAGQLTFENGFGTIQSTRNQALTLGGATTGNITLSPGGSAAGFNVVPGLTNNVDLGTAGLNWRNIYGQNIYSNGTLLTNGGFWQRNLGALSPTNITDDLLIGGIATNSAGLDFSITGIAKNQPLASLSGSLVVMPQNGWGGQVGIGTTAPAFSLDVHGTGFNQFNLQGTNSNQAGGMQFTNDVGNYSFFNMYGSTFATPSLRNALAISNYNGSNIVFGFGNFSPAVTITSNVPYPYISNVGINNTLPGYRLDLADATANGRGINIAQTATSGTVYGLYSAATGASTTNVGGYFSATGATNNYGLLVANGNVGIGTSVPTATLDVVGNIVVNAGGLIDTRASGTLSIAGVNATTLTLGRSGQGITLPAFNTAGAVLAVNGSGNLQQTAQGLSGQCLISNAGSTPGWGSCISGSGTTNWWDLNSAQGTLVPINTTLDLLVGGTTTSSATFAFLNNVLARGSQIASFSGSLTLDSATASLQSTNLQALTLGGDTTGQLVLKGFNSAVNGITFSGYNTCILETDSNGIVTCGTNNTGGVSPFSESLGTIIPNNSTEDLLIGGQSTSSAAFQILALANGTTRAGTASLSGDLTFRGSGTNTVYYLNNSSLNFTTSQGGTINNGGGGDINFFSTTGQAQLPGTRYYLTTFTANIGGTNYIYELGGAGFSTVYKATIDTSGNIGAFSTTSQGQLPQTLYSHTTVTATIGGTTYVYVLGGQGASAQSTVYKATIDTSGNIGAFSTTSQGQLPVTRQDHSTVTATIGGTTYVYVLGGTSASTVYKATIDGSGNIGAFSTTSQGQLPVTKNYTGTITAIDGGTTYIYVLGGAASTVYKATINSSGNIGAFSTTNQGQLPQYLSANTNGYASASVGGITYVYALGGTNATGNVLSTVYRAAISPTVTSLSLNSNGGAAIGNPYAGQVAPPQNGLIVAGNVGIGTANPTVALSVVGNALFQAAADTTALVIKNALGTQIFGFDTSASTLTVGSGVGVVKGGSDLTLQSTSNTSGSVNISGSNAAGAGIKFNIGGNQAGLFTNNGNFGVGTGSYGPSNTIPRATIDIAGNASIAGSLSFNNYGTNNINLLNGSNLNFVTSAGGADSAGDIIGAFSTTSQGQLPATRINHATVTAIIGGTTYIYALGGSSASTVYKATVDTSGNIGAFSTTSQGQLPAINNNPTAATVTIAGTTYIYVLGGSTTSTVYKATIDGSGNIGAFSTTSQGQLPQPLLEHTTVTTTIGGTNYIYALGGMTTGSINLSTVYKATIDGSGNIGAFSTTSQGQLPQTLYQQTTNTVTIGGTTYIYVLGGINAGSRISTVYKAIIDTSGNIGSFSTNNQGQLVQAMYYHQSNIVTIGGANYIYVVGGNNNTGVGTQTVYKAPINSNGEIGGWEINNQAQLPVALYQHTTATATIGGTNYIYVLGGSSTSTVYKATISNGAGTSALSINNSGNVGIGTTVPNFKLDVVDTQIATSTAMFTNLSTSSTADVLSLKVATTSSQLSNYFVSFLDGNGDILGKIQGNGSGGVSYATNGVDFAEYYKKANPSDNLVPGTLACLSTSGGVTSCDASSSAKLLGVVSDRAGFVGQGQYQNNPSYVLIGIIGQLPVNVSTQSAIVSSDPLTVTSDGKATVATTAGYIIGHALEGYDPSETTTNQVLVSINVSWYDPNGLANDTQNSSPPGSVSDLSNKVDILNANLNALQNMFIFNSTASSFLYSATNASGSGQFLPVDSLNITNATISGSLFVLGRTTLNDLGITGTINSGLLVVNGLDSSVGNQSSVSINTLSGDLYLQNQGLGGVNILAGKVTIDTNGNINVEGVLGANTIKTSKLIMQGSVGNAILPAGNSQIEIDTPDVTSTSKVFVTLRTLVNVPLVVASIGNGKFVVEVSNSQTSDINFDWWVVGTR